MRMAATRLALAATFAGATIRYWSSVYPTICRETRYWHHRAQAIPDPVLRRLALEAQHIKRGNIEGAAAFAAFAPRTHRDAAIRAQVAFQSIYDYADTLAEQPSEDPILNGQQLHQALLVALDHLTPHSDYYAHHPQQDDNGYLREIIDACRNAVSALPSYPLIAASVGRLTARIVAYQSLNLNESHGGHLALEKWALEETSFGTELRWWETAASAGSSLAVFALIAAAAQPALPSAQVDGIIDAYWPWVGALHSLLDSVADQAEDAAAGQRSLLDYYTSQQEASDRLEMLATESLRRTAPLLDNHQHKAVITAMASHYLSSLEASCAIHQQITHNVLGAMGQLATPTMIVFKTKRRVSNASACLRSRRGRDRLAQSDILDRPL